MRPAAPPARTRAAVRRGAVGPEDAAVGCGGPAARRRATAGFGGAAFGIARTVRAAACSAVAPRTRRSTAASEAAGSAAGEGMVADRGSAGTVSVVNAERGSNPSRWEGSHSVVSGGRHATYAHGCGHDP